MVKRACIDCSQPTQRSRCTRCQNAADRKTWASGKGRRYDTEWRKRSAETRAAWVETNGWVCPGYETERHQSRDLVVDHDIGVLCRQCNAVKAATADKQRNAGG